MNGSCYSEVLYTSITVLQVHVLVISVTHGFIKLYIISIMLILDIQLLVFVGMVFDTKTLCKNIIYGHKDSLNNVCVIKYFHILIDLP